MKPLYCKTGDSILVKQRGRKTKWEVLEVGDGRSCKAKNSATGQVKPFQIKESHIVVPPDSEVPESLRQQLPRSIGVCRWIGSLRGSLSTVFDEDARSHRDSAASPFCDSSRLHHPQRRSAMGHTGIGRSGISTDFCWRQGHQFPAFSGR